MDGLFARGFAKMCKYPGQDILLSAVIAHPQEFLPEMIQIYPIAADTYEWVRLRAGDHRIIDCFTLNRSSHLECCVRPLAVQLIIGDDEVDIN